MQTSPNEGCSLAREPLRLKILLGILAAVCVLWVLVFLVLARAKKATVVKARCVIEVKAIAAALGAYQANLGAFPPDTVPGVNGSEVLYRYLCMELAPGGVSHGPYLMPMNAGDPNGNGIPELVPPGGGTYEYRVIIAPNGKQSVLVIDPGPDKLLGGAINAAGVFVPSNTDQNGDGVPDHMDNIRSDGK